MAEFANRHASGTRRRGHIVLVVDDHTDVRLSIVALLGGEGYGVLQAADGPEALDVARAARPDAILLDLTLPGIDGLETARRLRTERRTARIPILLLTGWALNASDVRECGADGVLSKPCVAEVLFERLRRVIERPGERGVA